MLRGSRTLKVGPHFRALPHATRVVYPLTCSLTSELFRMLRRSCTLTLGPRFGATPRAPGVAHPHSGLSLRGGTASSEGRACSSSTLTSELSRVLLGSRALTLGPHFEAIPRGPRVVYPQVGPSLRSYPARPKVAHPHIGLALRSCAASSKGSALFEANPHAPRVGNAI